MKNLFYFYFISALLFASCEVIPSDDLESNGKEPITDMPYSQIPDKDYTIELDRWDIPNDGTSPVKTTDNLQAAIDWAVTEGFGKIHLPAGHYLVGKYGHAVYQSGIELKSNMAFLLDKDAIIEMAPNDKWNYSVVSVFRKKYVVISGGTIFGDRDKHTYTPSARTGSTAHDEGALITISSESEYVTIENIALSKATGDGILLVGGGGDGSSVKYIEIRKNNIFENRRQGISIVGGVNILIEENEIHHIKGTDPQFGIDIESVIYSSKDIIIRSNHFHHNQAGNIVNFDGKNLLIEDNILEQGEGNNYSDGAVVIWESSDLVIRHNEITSLSFEERHTVWCGILMYPSDYRKTNSAIANIHNNTFTNCGFYMKNGSNLSINDNTLKNGFMNFYDMKNLTLKNNKVERNWAKCRLYAFERVAGFASGNIKNGEPINIPLSSDPFDGDTCNM